MISKHITKRSTIFTHVECTTFTFRHGVNYVRRSACEVMPNKESRIRSTNSVYWIEESIRVTNVKRARKGTY